MRRLTRVLALTCVFLVAGGAVMVARSPAGEDAVTRTVGIPGTGLAVTLPAEWRIWQAGEAGHPTEVVATDVAAGGRCSFSAAEGVTSATSAAHDFAETLDARQRDMVVERTSLTVPAGDAYRVSYRFEFMPEEPRFVFHDFHLDAGDGVMRFSCSGAEPLGDDWLHLAEAIAPNPTNAPAPAPFDPRVEVPDHGLAVEFGDEWLVRAWPGDGLLLGGVTVMRADSVAREGVGSSSECWVEDETGVPSLSGLSSLDDWREAFVEAAEARGQRTSVPAVTHADLRPGGLVRADWRRFNGMQAAAWVISTGDRRSALF